MNFSHIEDYYNFYKYEILDISFERDNLAFLTKNEIIILYYYGEFYSSIPNLFNSIKKSKLVYSWKTINDFVKFANYNVKLSLYDNLLIKEEYSVYGFKFALWFDSTEQYKKRIKQSNLKNLGYTNLNVLFYSTNRKEFEEKLFTVDLFK